MVKLSRFVRKNLALLLILVSALAIRLYVFDYPLVAEETNRDLLIARHITKYQEFVSLGPKNGTLLEFGNSPTYFYFLAIQFAVFDNVMFVSSVNLLMQLASIVILYFIAREIFGKQTAIITGLLLSFSGLSVRASVWPWQPYSMYFVITLAYFFLFLAHKKESFVALLVGAVILVFSASLHMSAFAILPAFGLTVFFILKRQKRRVGYFFFLLFATAAATALFFSPLIIHAKDTSLDPLSFLGQVSPMSPKDFLLFLMNRTILLAKTLPALSTAFIGGSVFYLKTAKDGRPKKAYLLLLFWTFSFLIVFSLIDGRFFDQHLYPVLPLVTIIAAENVQRLSLNVNSFVKYLIVSALVLLSAWGGTDKARGFDFPRLTAAMEVADSLAQELKEIKENENRPDFNFFRFQIYAPSDNEWFSGNRDIIDSIYWLLLERELGAKLVKVSDGEFEAGYEKLDTGEYILLDCLNYFGEDDPCVERFLNEFPGYFIKKKVGNFNYSNSFFLAKDNVLTRPSEE